MGGRGGGSGMGSNKYMTVFGTADTPSGYTVDDFRKMDDDELSSFMNYLSSPNFKTKDGEDLPAFLNGASHYQRLVYDLGLNDAPQNVPTQAALDKMIKNNQLYIYKLYRTVNDTTYSWGGSLSAKDQLDMLTKGDTTYIGNGIYGDGLYFANDLKASQAYGYRGMAKTVVAGIDRQKMNAVDIRQLQSEYDQYMNSHRYRVRKSFKDAAKVSTNGNSYAQFALLRGYNVIMSGSYGSYYYNVLDRSILVTADKYKDY